MARTRFTGRNGSYHKQDLEALERWAPTTKRAVIVGGGLIGIEFNAAFPQYPCHFLVREKFWDGVFTFGESQMINRHTELVKDKGLCQQSSPIKETIDCEIVGLTVFPNVNFLKTLVLN
jgi:hypothetical protein